MKRYIKKKWLIWEDGKEKTVKKKEKKVKNGCGETKMSLSDKIRYVKTNWQLYVVFLLPALLITVIFKYIPMGGVLLAFKDYSAMQGVLEEFI